MGTVEGRGVPPARIKAWANLHLKDSPGDLAASAAGRAALAEAAGAAVAAGETTIAWYEGGADADGCMDAHASGDASDVAPLLAALGERGFRYGIDVDVAREDEDGEERPDEDVHEEFERVVGLCGGGVDYAEAYDVA